MMFIWFIKIRKEIKVLIFIRKFFRFFFLEIFLGWGRNKLGKVWFICEFVGCKVSYSFWFLIFIIGN